MTLMVTVMKDDGDRYSNRSQLIQTLSKIKSKNSNECELRLRRGRLSNIDKSQRYSIDGSHSMVEPDAIQHAHDTYPSTGSSMRIGLISYSKSSSINGLSFIENSISLTNLLNACMKISANMLFIAST
ncbi:hypothetical protein LOAG_08448 [Loa loa]|uniref:Uncharacterized protein n=1 Tax=Loa loa TaxID=7209 RepID=A0A1S0TUF8_LOALO|nr:hypothetical protein LOAG_08448 [Loa loa]EFO20041.1 hypothetical protein LOAG_08448 [Loa loa]